MGADQSVSCGQACFGDKDGEGKDTLIQTNSMSGMVAMEEENVSLPNAEPVLPAAKADPAEPENVVLEYKDDATYTGEVVNGKRHGNGTYNSPVETYVGQWQDDKQHGSGKHTWSDGRSYDGQYAGGRFSGSGKMVWTSDKGIMVYDGQYQDDVKHGHGKFTWPNGNIYEGGWSGGKRHGRAKFLTSAGKQKEGLWSEDKFIQWLDENSAA